MALVLIQHLDPKHHSLLREILATKTQMQVQEAQDTAVIEPNCIYVIPPNRVMSIRYGCLHLVPRDLKQKQHRPIDTFLFSLAADRGSQAIAVILSGADADGALGLQAVKEAGGNYLCGGCCLFQVH